MLLISTIISLLFPVVVMVSLGMNHQRAGINESREFMYKKSI
jgi:hypothetical protein